LLSRELYPLRVKRARVTWLGDTYRRPVLRNLQRSAHLLSRRRNEPESQSSASLHAGVLPVPVYAKLTDSSGNIVATAFLHFQLVNCGVNYPTVASNTLTVVQTAFDLKPNQNVGYLDAHMVHMFHGWRFTPN